jgi:hypothetical protein
LSFASTQTQKKRPAYRLYTILVEEKFCRARAAVWDDEGAERNSTKLDWYFWSRGAMRRWTWDWCQRSGMEIEEGCEKESGGSRSYLAFELDFLFIGVWRVPFCEAGFALPVLDEDERENHL